MPMEMNFTASKQTGHHTTSDYCIKMVAMSGCAIPLRVNCERRMTVNHSPLHSFRFLYIAVQTLLGGSALN